MENNKKIHEEQLKEVTGGWSENRYNPAECKSLNKIKDECLGFLFLRWCDHYRQTYIRTDAFRRNPNERETYMKIYKHECAMGAFKAYEGPVEDVR